MLGKKVRVLYLFLFVLVLALAACAPVAEEPAANTNDVAAANESNAPQDAASVAEQAGAEDESEMSADAPAEGEGDLMADMSASDAESNAMQSGDGGFVDVTPMSDEERANLVPSESGAGAAGGAGSTAPGAGEDANLGATVPYRSEAYGFEVDYPDNFDVRDVPQAERAQLQPTPIAWYTFMRPGAANSGAVEPADLEVRVFDGTGFDSLQSWLIANNLVAADDGIPVNAVQFSNVGGVELCSSTMIAPGCSYYILQGGWVYQMIPASLKGEAMMNTFRVTQ